MNTKKAIDELIKEVKKTGDAKNAVKAFNSDEKRANDSLIAFLVDKTSSTFSSVSTAIQKIDSSGYGSTRDKETVASPSSDPSGNLINLVVTKWDQIFPNFRKDIYNILYFLIPFLFGLKILSDYSQNKASGSSGLGSMIVFLSLGVFDLRMLAGLAYTLQTIQEQWSTLQSKIQSNPNYSEYSNELQGIFAGVNQKIEQLVNAANTQESVSNPKESETKKNLIAALNEELSKNEHSIHFYLYQNSSKDIESLLVDIYFHSLQKITKNPNEKQLLDQILETFTLAHFF